MKKIVENRRERLDTILNLNYLARTMIGLGKGWPLNMKFYSKDGILEIGYLPDGAVSWFQAQIYGSSKKGQLTLLVDGRVSNYLSGLLSITKAAITPGTQPQMVSINTITMEPQPLSMTARGGNKIDRRTLQILM